MKNNFKKWISTALLALFALHASAAGVANSGAGVVEKLFIQNGTGAVARTFKKKAQEVVSLEDFGGSPSASAATNDAAFAAAFAASNHVIVAEEGTFNYSSGLVLLGKTLTGRGIKNTILHYTGSGVAITIGGSDATPPVLENFQLTGTASASDGILLSYAGTGVRNATLNNLYISGFTNTGAYGVDIAASLNNGVYYNLIKNVHSSYNYGGFRIYSSDGVTNGNRANANTFIDDGAQYNTADGFYFDWAVGNTLTGCDREQNGGYGINTDHVLDMTVVGGYSENNTSGWLKKTANGSVRAFGGRTADVSTSSIVQATGDMFLVGVTGFTTTTAGGIGIAGGKAFDNTINTGSAQDLFLAINASNYLQLRHASGTIGLLKPVTVDAVSITPVAGAITLSASKPVNVVDQLTANITSITFPTAVDGMEVTIEFQQGAVGGFTVGGWPGIVHLAGGAFTLTPTANKVDEIKFRYNSARAAWIEQYRSQNM